MREGAELVGLKDLERAFADLRKLPDTRQAESIFYKHAKSLRGSIRKKAPKGPTGNLKRGIVAKKLKKHKNEPASFVGIDYRIAPHAHLVERGTSLRVATEKAKKTPAGGTWVYFAPQKETFYKVQAVGPMPAHPFFWPTVDARQATIARGMSKDIKRLIERTGRK